jgi:hypothetical protein
MARPAASQSEFAARPTSPRPPERIETLPSINRPEPMAKPAAATLADAGVKPMPAARPAPAVRPAGASIADAGIKPLSPAKSESAIRQVAPATAPAPRPVAEPKVESTSAPAKAAPAPVKPAPVAKATAPVAEPATKAAPKATAKAEAKAPAADGEHRCEDCNKTADETTFPRKGDWISKVCRACRKSRGLRP